MYWIGVIICGISIGKGYSEPLGWFVVGAGLVIGGLINAFGGNIEE